MGQWYQIGLQCGKNVAAKVDELIEMFNKDEWDNWNPKSRTILHDGSIIYSWYMKWNPGCILSEKKFLKSLREFDDLHFYEIDEEDYLANAYKLIGAGDEGGEINEGNESGYDLFDDLYITHDVHLPE